MNKPSQKRETIIILVVSLMFIFWSLAFIYKSSFVGIDGKRYFCLFDDAMVSMRYASNLSNGLGLVWNSDVHIEGYTNLLMTLLMSISTLIFDKTEAVLFIQLIGVVVMLAIANVSMRISDDIYHNNDNQTQRLYRILSFLCPLVYYPLVYWSLMGMETGLLTLLLLLGMHSALVYARNRQPRILLLATGYLGLAYLTRNDSIIFATLIWLYILWEISNTRFNNKGHQELLGAISIYFFFILGQQMMRHFYYGELLPNTYVLKLSGMPLLLRVESGAQFIQPFLLEIAVFLVLSSVDAIIHFQKQKLLLLSIVFSAIAYQVYVGGDAWNYWRIMSPSVPLLAILFLGATKTTVCVLSTRYASTGFLRKSIFPQMHRARITLILLTLIGFFSANMRFLHEILFLVKPYSSDFNQINVNTAIMLNWLTTNEASIGVYWAGSIPYFTDRQAIDFLGKSDEYIAHLPPDLSGAISWNGMTSVPGHNKYDLNYSITTLLPTYVQSFVWGTQDLSEWAETRYIKIEYDGIRLYLLKDSPAVLWGNIDQYD